MAKKNKNIPLRHPWRHLVRDVLTSIKVATSSVDYIREHRLWEGLNQYKWLSKALVVIAIIVGVSFFRFINQWYEISDVSQQGIFGLETGLFASMVSAGKEIFFARSYKYVMLLLVEVLVFHFVRRTLIFVTGEHIKTDFKTFLSTQYRMVGVTIVCAVFEGLFSKLFNIPLNWLGLEILSPVMFLVVQAYFMGVVIVDNYNEVYHMSFKQSLAYCWQYAGVTLFVGTIVSVLFFVPLLGIIIGPILGAVIAARTMHYLYEEDLDREWVFKRYPKKLKEVKVENSPS
ncbi:MAG: hypothetical protein ACI9P5_004171 [Saprospiraceae bacterium]